MGKWTYKNSEFFLDGARVTLNKVAVYFESYQAMIDQKNSEICELKTTVAKLKKGAAIHYKEESLK